jgi:prohibitin 2
VLRAIGIAILLFVVVLVIATSTFVVQPGFRGVQVTLGTVSPEFHPEGFGLKPPFISRILPISIRQQTRMVPAECYSSDLQQVTMDLSILYRVPERSVVRIFQEYAGAPFENLIAPRVQEALKEVAASQSAEMIVKKREDIKLKSLALARNKVGTNFLEIVDLVLYNMRLSPELEQAIEQKMVQEQEAEKAKFTRQKTGIEADTAIIRAKGDAEAIQVRGKALRENPDFIQLQILQNWNGQSPLVIGAQGGANMLLSIDRLVQQRAQAQAQEAQGSAAPARGANPRR